MKLIDYDKLLQAHKPKGYISEDANVIANILIRELCVQAGTGLARFLGVDTCFENHMAIRVWVQRRLDAQDGYLIDEMCCQLEAELYGALPHANYGY